MANTNLAELNALATKITGQTVAENSIVAALNKIASYYKGSSVAEISNAAALAEIEDNYTAGGGADIQANKAVTITTNTVTEVTPDDGKDGMAKVTVTTNVPTTSATPPEWFTNGKDSIPPVSAAGIIVFADEINSFDGVYGNSLSPDGTSTLAELYLARVESATAVQSVSYFGAVPNGANSPADIFIFAAITD